MAHTNQSIGTLVSISGTMASIGLALVGIVSAKSSLEHTASIADDLFLFSSLGFLFVLVMGYLAQKNPSSAHSGKLVSLAEWIFTLSLGCTVFAAFILVYTKI